MSAYVVVNSLCKDIHSNLKKLRGKRTVPYDRVLYPCGIRCMLYKRYDKQDMMIEFGIIILHRLIFKVWKTKERSSCVLLWLLVSYLITSLEHHSTVVSITSETLESKKSKLSFLVVDLSLGICD